MTMVKRRLFPLFFRLFSPAILLILLGMGQPVMADLDISVQRGDYEIFYSAFNTSFISPDVARAAGITRGKNKGLVNISVVRYEGGERIPVEVAAIEGEAWDLIYRNALDFKPIVEPGAVYYLAPFKITNDNEFIQFSIQVQPEGLGETVDIKFKRNFYLD